MSIPTCPQSRNSSSHVSIPAPAPPPAAHTWSPATSALDDCVSYLEKEVTSIR